MGGSSTPTSGYHFNYVQLPINNHLNPNYVFAQNPAYGAATNYQTYDYFWIFVASCLASFFAAFALGSNDVANSFAPSVGAKTLKLWQACLIAAFCEFFGAYLLGARATDTIKSKIVSMDAFIGNDDLLMFGFLCADLAAGCWMIFATFFELHVSSTHSTIGAVVGFSLATPLGAKSVNWPQVGLIIGSWVIAPIVSGIMSALMFVSVRYFVLRRSDSFERSLKFYPLILWFTIALNLSFIFVKSAIPNGAMKTTVGEAVGIAIATGFGAAVLSWFTLVPFIRRRYVAFPEIDPSDAARMASKAKLDVEEAKGAVDEASMDIETPALKENGEESPASDEATDAAEVPATTVSGVMNSTSGAKLDKTISFMPASAAAAEESQQEKKKRSAALKSIAAKSENAIHGVINTDTNVSTVHDQAEVFSYRTECVLSLVQVLTACCASFAHGANDVGNAIGPLAAVYAIYSTGSVANSKKVAVADWILILGASGIVLGLSTIGYKILRVMGVKISKLTPSRGFAIELGASTIILIFSSSGIPLSSTHCSTGSTVAVGLAEWKKGSVNWKPLRKIFAAWVLTIFMAGGLAAFFFSFGTFAPSQIYPLSQGNCLYMFGQVYNQSAVANPTSEVCVPVVGGSVSIIAGYPSNGQFAYVRTPGH